MKLWRQVHAEFQFDDIGGIELLAQACAGIDRAESLAARIEADGELIRGPQGLKCHPGIREEMSARAFVVRTLMKLGLNYEPLRTGR
jgi:hypothetical protein